MKTSLCIFSLISLLTLNVFAGDITISIESSGDFKLDKEFESIDTSGIREAYEESMYQRHELTKEYAKCRIDTCENLFMSPLGDLSRGLVDELGESKGRAYFLTMLSGLMMNENAQMRSVAEGYAKLGLSFEEKLYVAQNIGEVMVRHYDFDRTDQNDEAFKGIVTEDEIFSAIRSGSKAGVCRDISTAQAGILERMGVEKTYLIAYSTVDDGHVTVIAQDENDPSVIYQLNYGDLTAQQRGIGMFNQTTETANAGFMLYIYDAKGQAVDTVSSEVGYVLMRAAGMEIDRFEAGVTKEGIKLTSLDYHSGKIKTTLVGAISATGGKMLAIGSSLELGKTKNWDFIVSLSAHSSIREDGDFLLDEKGALLGMQTRLRTNKIDLGFLKKNYVEIDLGTGAYFGTGVIGIDDEEYRSGKVKGNNIYLNASYGTEIDIVRNVTIRNRTTIHSRFMKSDVRDEESSTLLFTGVTVANDVLVELGDQYLLEFSNKVYIRKNSTTMTNIFYLKSKDGRTAIELGYGQPLSDNAQPWMDGAQKDVRIGIQKKISRFEVDFKYKRLIDLDENVYNMELRGRF